MNWTELLIDNNKITAIYGNKKPSLNCIELHEVVLSREGPQVTFRFDLSEFPPKKWKSAGFNCVQIQLTTLSVHDLKIEGLNTVCKCPIIISSKEKLIPIDINEEKFKIQLTAEHLILDKVSAYLLPYT